MSLESQINHLTQKGSIEVICGSMFSGKTEELLRRLKRAQFAKLEIAVFKPKIDNRYDTQKVVSHDENTINAIPVDCAKNILQLVNQAQVVAIDEAQFFDADLVAVCNELANAGVRVIIAGLDMDYKGKPFGPMPNLLAVAEYITKLHAICTRTGKMANYTHRIVKDKELIVVGDETKYEAVSRKAFKKLGN